MLSKWLNFWFIQKYTTNGGDKNCDQIKFDGMTLKKSATLSYYILKMWLNYS